MSRFEPSPTRSTPNNPNFPFICGDGETLYNAIDPHLFVDTDGSPWLAFGSTLGGILLAPLDPETLAPAVAPSEFTTLAERPLLQDDPILSLIHI